MVETVEAIVRAGAGPSQKADPGAIAPIVVPVTLLRGARHLGRNATIATKKAISPSIAHLSNVAIPISVQI